MLIACLALLVHSFTGRIFHPVPLDRVKASTWTHIQTCGPVVYVGKQRDGDWHITLDNGKAKIVLEIIPELPMVPPRKGQTIIAKGISRIDRGHESHAELHPLIGWTAVPGC